jgi:hypothetical protein
MGSKDNDQLENVSSSLIFFITIIAIALSFLGIIVSMK